MMMAVFQEYIDAAKAAGQEPNAEYVNLRNGIAILVEDLLEHNELMKRLHQFI